MLTKEELENIKVGDIIEFEDYEYTEHTIKSILTQGKVRETRVRCGELGDVLEDYVILEDSNEVDYTDIKRVIR